MAGFKVPSDEPKWRARLDSNQLNSLTTVTGTGVGVTVYVPNGSTTQVKVAVGANICLQNADASTNNNIDLTKWSLFVKVAA